MHSSRHKVCISIFTGPLILRKFLELLTYQFALTLTSAASDNAYINYNTYQSDGGNDQDKF